MIEYKIEEKRFAAYDGDKEVGESTFSKSSNEFIIIDHTFVDDNYRGQGIAGKLIETAVNYARENGIKIIPLCPTARMMFDRHPEYKEVEYGK
ncbi:GNAT family N-acetyltransferase [Miniphocaeibacter halophilus]|uniref:GNAT family N-acetyltransferase n=1 Tax=Miniphocaeibacter halophilus TaxID=2931922 RepID=UPI001FB3B2CA|nr:GNAT family N-acetyltransferase [Miniphocaeibacter halophilus]